MRQLFYYKMRRKFVTKCARLFITKCESFITKRDGYAKLLQNTAVITNIDVYYKICR